MERLFAAAHAAARLYGASWRRGNIIRAQRKLQEQRLSRRLRNFYFDEIDREIDFIIFESAVDVA
ncbi:hypothetical protein [Bradyrhizobium sp. SZCCHNS3053]|uniref:hypothetical protein n=1 Tax=Bradyrhizobium sp. SZCCHNS3053 TaxID=3057322 RepID=UPI00291642B7|nr:hypothetical protein [Bradyrhizobium sp. SZCCHNS3053]